MKMDTIYAESDKVTPIIFVLSTGADPRELLLNFAKTMGVGDEEMTMISLG